MTVLGRYTNREILRVVCAFLIAGALTAWGTVYIVRTYVLARDYEEPLVKAGGLKPDQVIPSK